MKWYFFYSAMILGVSIDALSKYLTVIYILKEIIIIPGVLSLQYVQNPGIAFSLPVTGVFLKIITCVLIFGIFWYYITREKSKKNLLLDTGYILLCTGALGNAWERIFRGYVTDMIAVESFAVFNLADSCICIGAGIILYFYWKYN